MTLWSVWKQDLQGTYINTTVVLWHSRVCQWSDSAQMNNLQTERQHTLLQIPKGLSDEDSKTGDEQSVCSTDQQWLSHILLHESNSSSVPELDIGSLQAFLWQPYRDAKPRQQQVQSKALHRLLNLWTFIYASP